MKHEEEQSWICHQIIMEAHDGIIVADREGIIRLWNKGAEMIFGFSPVEALGQSLHLIIPENLRERHDQGYYKVMESGHSKYSSELLAVPALKKGGSRISVEFSMTLIRDLQGLGPERAQRDEQSKSSIFLWLGNCLKPCRLH